MFATRLDLLQRWTLTREVMQLSVGEDLPALPEDMMRKALSGASLSGYTADQQTVASAALAVVDNALNDATAFIKSYGINEGGVIPQALVRIAVDIAVYYLYRLRLSDEIRQRYEDAIAQLDKHAKGLINLAPVVDDPATVIDESLTNGVVQFSSNARRYGAGEAGDPDV